MSVHWYEKLHVLVIYYLLLLKKNMTKIVEKYRNERKEYKRHLGGVDLLDSNISRHKIFTTSEKWFISLFYHVLDMTLAKGWTLYRRKASSTPIPDEKMTLFFIFAERLYYALVKLNNRHVSRRVSNKIEETIVKKETG